ncbi:MAG: sulfatase-like hydrolase/transferase [Deltaproteobacteria bacterium]|nr:sulfatase-like hydrolase/transferase [Deltaproteobacteria bacterium]
MPNSAQPCRRLALVSPATDHAILGRVYGPGWDRTRAFSSLTRLATSLVLATFLLAAVETLRLALARGLAFPTAFEWLLLFLSLAAILGLGALPWFLMELGCVAVSLRWRNSPTWRLPRSPRLAGIIIGAAFFLLASWYKEYLFETFYITHAFDQVRRVALGFSALNVVLTVPLAASAVLVGLSIERILTRRPGMAQPVVRALRLGAPLVLAAATYGLVVRLQMLLPREVLLAATSALLLLTQAAASGLLPRKERAPSQRRALASGFAVLALAAAALIPASGAVPVLRHALFQRSLLAAPVLWSAAWLSDFDRDGASSIIGDADCAPFDPTVRAGAIDIPGDGIDQNCVGGDATGAPNATFVPLQPTPWARQGMNVIWIVIDSLRADRTAAGGSSRPLMPHLDAFARTAASFSHARAQGASTGDSFPSFLSSRYPMYLAHHPDEGRMEWSLTRALREDGYRTAMVTTFRSYPRNLVGDFEVVEASLASRKSFLYGVSSFDLTANAETILRLWQNERFFLLLHYFDPHGVYIQHPRFRYGDRDVDRYDSEVSFTDVALGAFFDLLEKNGILDRTVVVVSADHGEAFGEHGRIAHGGALYEELVRVPLVVKVPGLPPRSIAAPVGLIDVAPTILALLGMPDPGRLQGRSLAPLLAGDDMAPAPVYLDTEWPGVGRLLGVVTSDLKYVIDLSTGAEQLFDLRADPSERVNLVSRHGSLGDEPRALIARTCDGIDSSIFSVAR